MRGNASLFPHQSVHGAGGWRPPHPLLFQGLSALQLGEDRPGTGGATQAESSILPHLPYAIHHRLVKSRPGMLGGP